MESPPATPYASFDEAKLEQALAMSPWERCIAGAQLFDYACWISLQGIRSQLPNGTVEEWNERLRRRLSLLDEQEQPRPC